MIIAIVPAAGKSERMGRPKLLLPLGPRRVIEHVLDALTDSRVDRTIVVLPPDAGELRSVVNSFKVELVQLATPTPDMRSSLIFGLERAEELAGDAKPAAFLLALADQPTLSATIINQLIDRSRGSTKSIFLPTYRGQRGHPVLFSWSMAAHVRAIPANCGLDWLVDQRGSEVHECPVDDSGLLVDLDTPEDYERFQRGAW
jgi:molybdenum cofactor cytidylyltransferase